MHGFEGRIPVIAIKSISRHSIILTHCWLQSIFVIDFSCICHLHFHNRMECLLYICIFVSLEGKNRFRRKKEDTDCNPRALISHSSSSPCIDTDVQIQDKENMTRWRNLRKQDNTIQYIDNHLIFLILFINIITHSSLFPCYNSASRQRELKLTSTIIIVIPFKQHVSRKEKRSRLSEE